MVWGISGDDMVWFNMQKGHDMDKKMLELFDGLMTSDSLPAWNHVDREHRKCHLHHMKDLKKTMRENKSPEFQAFAKKPIL